MTQSVTPIAELGNGPLGTPVLKLSNLRPHQLGVIYDGLVINGDAPIHNARSNALAHLASFDTFTGMATIYVYGENKRENDLFVSILASQLAMPLPRIPVYKDEEEVA